MLATRIPVLFANNYDMRRARAGWRAGVYPAHHLFGTAGLGEPFVPIDLTFKTTGFAARLSRRAPGLGDVGVQTEELIARGSRAIVYGAFGPDLRALAALRRSGLLRRPIIGVFHGVPFGPSRYSRAALEGYDRTIALSRMTSELVAELGAPAGRLVHLSWGPDLDFPGFAGTDPPTPDAPVVSTGKTMRDLTTLIEALRRARVPARVHADVGSLTGVSPPPKVEIVPPANAGSSPSACFTYAHTLGDLRSAAVVAVPLLDPYPLHGLTEIADALACGRPVIVTRAPYFDFDIEAIGCGWWVERGDVNGWTETLIEALSDRARLARMGAAGRQWAAQNWNLELFTRGLRRTLLDVAGREDRPQDL